MHGSQGDESYFTYPTSIEKTEGYKDARIARLDPPQTRMKYAGSPRVRKAEDARRSGRIRERVLVGLASQIVRAGLGTGTVKDRKAPPLGAGKLGRCPVFLCAGLKSSGSTWLYNAVVQLVEDNRRHSRGKQQRTGLLRFYADGIRDFPPGAQEASALVIKTHIPSHSLEFLTRFARGSVLITVREPRDAVASLMQRFDHRFEGCLKEVAANASRMVDLFQSGEALVLRYEDRFYDRPETLDEIARHLHLKTSRFALQRTFVSLTARNIERRILSLSARGAFGETPTPDSFDPKTHWHPGHVGDRRIGKYAAVLTPKMQKAVLHAMRDYCAVFRYPIAGKPGPGRANSKRPSRGKMR